MLCSLFLLLSGVNYHLPMATRKYRANVISNLCATLPRVPEHLDVSVIQNSGARDPYVFGRGGLASPRVSERRS
jgi:hypothetical protein